MDIVHEINLYISASMVFGMSLGMVLVVFCTKDISPRMVGAAAAWLLTWCMLLFIYSFVLKEAYWYALMFDGLSTTSVLACALLLLPGDANLSISRIAAYCASVLVFLISWPLFWGKSIIPDTPEHASLRWIAAAPGMFISAGSFMALAYGASKHFKKHRIAIGIAACFYGLLQFPGYSSLVVHPESSNKLLVGILLAVGKAMLLVTTAFILIDKLCEVKRSASDSAKQPKGTRPTPSTRVDADAYDESRDGHSRKIDV
jgi:hypothetical protein